MWLWQNNQVLQSSTTQHQEVKMSSWGIIRVKRVLKKDWWNLVRCNYHVVLLQLERQPAVPLKRKRRYCEFLALDVSSSLLVKGQRNTLIQYLTLFLSLFLNSTQAGWRREPYLLTRQQWVSVTTSFTIWAKSAALIISKTDMHLLYVVQEESSSDITSLFPHLDMEPLTSSERYGNKTDNSDSHFKMN